MSSFFKLQTYVQTNKNAKVKKKFIFYFFTRYLKNQKFYEKENRKNQKTENT
jgi:hypothetical protein